MSLCSRCKELVLATVRAFFDLIDPETRQVRTNKLLFGVIMWKTISSKHRGRFSGELHVHQLIKAHEMQHVICFQTNHHVISLVHRRSREENGCTKLSLHQTSCQDVGRKPRLHLLFRLEKNMTQHWTKGHCPVHVH